MATIRLPAYPVQDIPKLRTYLRKSNRDYPNTMQRVPRDKWPKLNVDPMPIGVWRSNQFLAQVFGTTIESPCIRLSVNKAWLNDSGYWEDGITWDELMDVKRECGFGNRWAVEVYPPQDKIVDVANIRHLWMLPEKPDYAW